MARDVAVDGHRTDWYVVIRETDGTEVLRRRFPHAAREALRAHLRPGDRVIMEASTGAFQLANYLEQSGATVYVVDPQQTRLVGFRGKKTDYRDCLALLEYLRRGDLPVVWRPDPATRELRALTRERFSLNQGITRMKNRVRALLADEGLETPRALWSPAGRQWLAAQELRASSRTILTRHCLVIDTLTTLKESQQAAFAQWALALPSARQLMQLVGFGIDLAVMWVGEVGDLARFSGAAQLVSYAGLNPRVAQSGEHRRDGGISKAGRSQLRWIMVEAAHRHVTNAGPEAAYYHRLVARGKRPQVAIVALARRLLELAYRLLTRDEAHRALDLTQYERKLTRLAAHRDPVPAGAAEAAGPEPAGPTADAGAAVPPEQRCNQDWAAREVEARTGREAPYFARYPERRTQPWRRPPHRTGPRDGAGGPAAERRAGSTSGPPA